MTIFHSDVEPLSEYFSVTLHLSPATRVLNENVAVQGRVVQSWVKITQG